MVTSLGCAVVAGLINAVLIISTGASYSIQQQVGIAVVSLVGMAALNTARIDELALVSTFTGVIHLGTLLLLGIALLSLPSTLNPTDVIFSYHNETGFTDPSYVSVIGLLVPAFIFAGYDASAQMAEETQSSSSNSPSGIITAVVTSGFAGFFVLFSLLLSTLDIDSAVHGVTDYPLFNVFSMYLPQEWAIALCWLVVINVYFSIMSWVAVTTRRAYALARDNGLPFSGVLAYVEPHFQTPIACNIFVVISACLFLLFLLDPSLTVAYDAMVNLSVIGLYISYCIPIMLKLAFKPFDFPRGNFSLGALSIPFGVLSCIWLLSVAILGFCPTIYPVNSTSMNWSIIVACGYALIAYTNWMLYSRHYFEGPRYVSGEFLEKGTQAVGPSNSSPHPSHSPQKSPSNSESNKIHDRRLSVKGMRKNWFLRPDMHSQSQEAPTTPIIDI